MLTKDTHGTVDANVSARSRSTPEADADDADAGILEATSGGILVIDDDINNNGGTIAAHGDNSTVQLSDVTIQTGTLSTDDLTAADGGVIEIVSTGGGMSAFDGSDNAVTVEAYVQVDAGAELGLLGAIDNSGTIDVGTGSASAALELGADVTLSGGGAITLENGSDTVTDTATADRTLDNADNVTVERRHDRHRRRSSGRTNAGTIDADATLRPCSSVPAPPSTNTGRVCWRLPTAARSSSTTVSPAAGRSRSAAAGLSISPLLSTRMLDSREPARSNLHSR